MVEGITILNKIAVTGLPTWISISAIILFVIGLIVLVVSLAADWPVWTAIFPLIGLSVIVTCGILSSIIKTGEYRYECIIDNSVSYNEVVENYKVVEQRGDIWVLEDK